MTDTPPFDRRFGIIRGGRWGWLLASYVARKPPRKQEQEPQEPHPAVSEFGFRVSRLLKIGGAVQLDLMTVLNCGKSHINDLCNGKYPPDLPEILKLADFLEVDERMLMRPGTPFKHEKRHGYLRAKLPPREGRRKPTPKRHTNSDGPPRPTHAATN